MAQDFWITYRNMELSRGICVLCTNNTNVIVPPQAKDLTLVLKDVLVDQCDDEKFDAINPSLKVCPICVHDVLTTASLRKNIKEFNEHSGGCVLCYRKKKHLVLVSDWVHFDKTLKNVTLAERQSDCLACLDCIKCLEMLERIKSNLFKKYPKLRLTDLIEKGQNENAEYKKLLKDKVEPAKRTKKDIEYEIKSKSDLGSFQHNKKNVNNLKDSLKHLTPVKNTKFNIDGFKDKKLLKQIPYVKLNLSNMSVAKSKKVVGSSESESSGDSPSPKQSFFKIRLKISSNKPKLAKIVSSKVSKPRISQSVLNCKKQLIVKILKMDLEQIKLCHVENGLKNRTPTKASRKMLPEEPLSSSKKRKSVTFAEELDTEIIESLNRKNHCEATPLKSSLKKKHLHTMDSSKIGNDESNNETDDDDNVNLQKRSGINYDSEEEITKGKGYVEEILKNNDDIFNSLKKSENLAVASAELKSQMLSDNIISSSKNDIVVDKSANANKDDVSESIQSSEIKNNGEKESLENGDGETEVVDQAASVNEIHMTKEHKIISKEENDTDETSDKNAISDEADTKAYETSIEKTNGEVVSEKKRASVENDSSKLNDPYDELDTSEKSPDQECSNISESYDDVSSISKNTIEANDNDNEISSTVDIDSIQSSEVHEDNTESNNDETGRVDDSRNKNNQDLEAESGQKSVSKKRRRSTLEREEEDKDLIDDNGFGEPETKKEKVSETDDVNNAVSEKEIEPEEDDNCSKQTVAAVDNKIDELIAKYAHPGVQNLNVDNNVSDRRNAGANGKDQGSRSEDSPGGSEEAVEADEQSDNFKKYSEEEKSDEVTSKNSNSILTGLNNENALLDNIVDDSFIAGAEQ